MSFDYWGLLLFCIGKFRVGECYVILKVMLCGLGLVFYFKNLVDFYVLVL